MMDPDYGGKSRKKENSEMNLFEDFLTGAKMGLWAFVALIAGAILWGIIAGIRLMNKENKEKKQEEFKAKMKKFNRGIERLLPSGKNDIGRRIGVKSENMEENTGFRKNHR